MVGLHDDEAISPCYYSSDIFLSRLSCQGQIHYHRVSLACATPKHSRNRSSNVKIYLRHVTSLARPSLCLSCKQVKGHTLKLCVQRREGLGMWLITITPQHAQTHTHTLTHSNVKQSLLSIYYRWWTTKLMLKVVSKFRHHVGFMYSFKESHTCFEFTRMQSNFAPHSNCKMYHMVCRARARADLYVQ